MMKSRPKTIRKNSLVTGAVYLPINRCEKYDLAKTPAPTDLRICLISYPLYGSYGLRND